MIRQSGPEVQETGRESRSSREVRKSGVGQEWSAGAGRPGASRVVRELGRKVWEMGLGAHGSRPKVRKTGREVRETVWKVWNSAR
jgi:hypothetical protein